MKFRQKKMSRDKHLLFPVFLLLSSTSCVSSLLLELSLIMKDLWNLLNNVLVLLFFGTR